MIKLAVLGTIFIIGLYTIVGTTCQSRNEFIVGARSFTGFESVCKNVLK